MDNCKQFIADFPVNSAEFFKAITYATTELYISMHELDLEDQTAFPLKTNEFIDKFMKFIIHNLTIVACVHACLGLFVEHSRRHVQVFFARVVRKFLLHGALECRRVHVLEGDILHHLQGLDFCTGIFQIFHRVV